MSAATITYSSRNRRKLTNRKEDRISVLLMMIPMLLSTVSSFAFPSPTTKTLPSIPIIFSTSSSSSSSSSLTSQTWHPSNAFSNPVQSKAIMQKTSKSSSSTSLSMISPSSLLTTLLKPCEPKSAIAINTLLFLLLKTPLLKVLTPSGYISAFILGSGLWMSVLGWKAWTLCVLYLGLGSLVTKIKFQEKESQGIAEGRGGRRGPENVWGSALTGLICTTFATLYSKSSSPTITTLLTLAYVASISTKLSDTFASEIGKAYGKTTFLITTFQKVPPGTEGAVSLEGTLAALGGALILPLYGYSVGLLSQLSDIVIVTLSAFLATFCESWIGAALQGKQGFTWMTNEVVNFFNTVIGATFSIVAALVFQLYSFP